MKLHTFPVSILLAALIGAAHTYLLILAWVYIGLFTPLPGWLISHGLRGASFYGVLYPADLLTNMLLCVPAAYLLCRLRPARLWAYLAVALLPGFLWQYRLVLAQPSLVLEWQTLLPGALMALLPLPLTSLIIRRVVAGPANRPMQPELA